MASRLTTAFASITLNRFSITLVLFAALSFFCLVRWWDDGLYQALISIPIGNAMPRPFGDLGTILRAGTCWRHGVAVYAANACMAGGQYNYSPLLLRAAYLPIGISDQMPGGVLLALAFIASMVFLPAPASGLEFLLRLLASLSTSVIFAVEQANFDLVIFVMAVLGIWLLPRGRLFTVVGYGLFLFAAALKFYPVALLGLLPRERRRIILIVAFLASAAFLAYEVYFAQATAAALAVLPKGSPFNTMFGVTNLPFGLVLLHFLPRLSLAPGNAAYHAAISQPIVPMLAVLGTQGVRVAVVVAARLKARRYCAAFAGLAPARGLYLTAGGLVIVLCYLLAQNVAYRGIFLVLTIPGLWALQKDMVCARFLLAAVLSLLWEPVFRLGVGTASHAMLGPAAIYPEIVFWILREVTWWWVIVQLLAMLMVFAKLNFERLWRGRSAVSM